MESSSQRRDRLKAEGRWQAFVNRRDSLSKSGLTAKEAYAQAASEFEPGTAAGPAPAPVTMMATPAASGTVMQEALAGLQGSVPLDREASVRDVVAWCFEKYSVPWQSISVDDVPSSGALGLLVWLKTSPANYTEFIRSIWTKLLPSRSVLERGSGFDDDGRATSEISRILEEETEAGTEGEDERVLREGSQGSSREPEVSPADPGAGED